MHTTDQRPSQMLCLPAYLLVAECMWPFPVHRMALA